MIKTKQKKIQTFFNQSRKLSMKNKWYAQQVMSLADWFLKEDLGKRGDVTSRAVVTEAKKAKARIIAKESGIIAGIEEATMLLSKKKVIAKPQVRDGARVQKNKTIMTLRGNAHYILTLERTILNIISRMSGIASRTNKIVKKINNKCLICSTRKTQWSLLDKKAVVLGGGGTHRLGLHDFVLIKENHLALMEGTLSEKKISGFWEVEVENKREAHEVAVLNPDAILFDNMSPKKIKETIRELPQNIIFEASGGINEKTISQYAGAGVEIISLGALTHSVSALDVGLYID